jgi:hypothetical protein
MKYLVALVTVARAALYVICSAAIVWLAVQAADRRPEKGAVPASARPLKTNDRLAPGDLRTPSIDALIGKYMRADLDPGKPVLPDMVSDRPIAPVMPSGVDIVVNVDRQVAQKLDLQPGRSVRLEKDGLALIEAATVVAAPCDQTRCAVILTTGKATKLDPSSLIGSDLVPIAQLDATTPRR